MRKKIVAGNWKMNKSLNSGINLCQEIIDKNKSEEDVEIIVIPPFIHLSSLIDICKNSAVKVGSQNNHAEASGAFTGEVSANMLGEMHVSYGLVGHSERRTYNKESDAELFGKTMALIKNCINPIFCVGEHLEQRKSGNHFNTVKEQLKVVFELNEEDFSKIVIAYEPVWAIGTGETASSEQAQEVHAFIRKEIESKYSTDIASKISILYGGSCKPSNAKELFGMKDVDGGLIGGASLNSDNFTAIINSF